MRIEWDEEKNQRLLVTRGISFEVVEEMLAAGAYEVRRHPDQRRYRDQVLLIFEFQEYTWVCPAERREDQLRLITIYPSRKYRRQRGEHD